MIIDAHATDTVPSHEVRRRAQQALTNAGEPMSEVTYDALRKRIAELEAALRGIIDYVEDTGRDYCEWYHDTKEMARAALERGK